MILVDTSVLIYYWRQPRSMTPSFSVEEEFAICGVTLSELLQGAKSPSDVETIKRRLAAFQLLTIEESLWERLGTLLAHFRRNGLTVPFQDALIAAVALQYQVQVWTLDTHFTKMAAFADGLKLWIEKPS